MIIQVLSIKNSTELESARWEAPDSTINVGDVYLLVLGITQSDAHKISQAPGIKIVDEKELVLEFSVSSVKRVYHMIDKTQATVVGITAKSVYVEALFSQVFRYQESLSGMISD